MTETMMPNNLLKKFGFAEVFQKAVCMVGANGQYFRAFERAASNSGAEAFLTIYGADATSVTQYSYLDFWRQCEVYKTKFKSTGFEPGEVALIFAGTDARTYFAFFGAQMAGLAPAIMPPPSSKQDIGYYRSSHRELIQRIQPSLVYGVAAALNVFDLEGLGFTRNSLDDIEMNLWRGPRNDVRFEQRSMASGRDIALLQHSSGTTGLKKGVMLTYEAVCAQVRHYAEALRVAPDDKVVTWLPLYHDMGLIACTVLPFVTAIPIVVMDPFTWLSQPLALMRAIEAHRGTLMWLPNFAFEYLANANRRRGHLDLSSLRLVTNCSEVCRASSMRRFGEAYAKSGLRTNAIQTSYALAENVFAASQSTPGEGPRHLRVCVAALHSGRVEMVPGTEDGSRATTELVSSGAPLRGCEIAIKTEDGLSFDDGRLGEIVIRSDCLFEGYFRNEELSRERLSEGRYETRDLGFLWQGHVFVLGRLDDVIIYRGRNLFAPDIEASLLEVPGVKPGRVVAFGIFDERVGSDQVVVMYEPAEFPGEQGQESTELAVRGELQDRFGVNPLHVVRSPPNTLAKTTSGKISRKLNKEKFLVEAGISSL